MTDRARDPLGRPLPADADPSLAAEAVVDLTGADDAAVWSAALAYLDRGMPFHAHEVFEDRWRICDPIDREAWRGLAQWGAALTHEARGNPEGARRLAARAATTLTTADSVPPCVDLATVVDSCDKLTAEGP